MRVALTLGTSAGGVGRHVHDLVTGLTRQGAEVVVACPPSVEQHFGFAAVGAVVVPMQVNERPHPRHDARAVALLRELRGAVDVVHAHGLRAGALACLAEGDAPVVVTLHNAAPVGLLARTVYGGLERLVASRADLVLGVSRDLVERARSLGAERVGDAVVAAPPPTRPTRDRPSVRVSLGVDARTPLIVTVGRLTAQKHQSLLLDALAQRDVWQALSPLALIAGEGPDRDPLARRIAADRLPVRLLGHRDDVPDLLAAADVVVSTADWEGQPVWLQEALRQGAAIVATDAGGTAAVVGDAAILVPVGDGVTLSRALADVLRHGAVRDDLRSKAVERADALPTSADALEAALTAYAEVGKGHGGETGRSHPAERFEEP